ncbi:TetR/AcrR family transcriptional regulator [Microbacterium neungamense]|uniref:TetR/AcrR family transcriptional regulator n=1 Tax=Microbacterium neungamense TaxID=2810535 RepID=UPI00217E911D|nr:TetR/AcrR family transcriptional regulator [Microbacterium neungamense]UWF77563.1 TetR/AcrR family transcriptional regulator [Microbacterium neungamense]
MGRPRMHDEATALRLLDAAERLIESSGVEALSIRALAGATGTSTRAVYSTFGSKRDLLAALAGRAFRILEQEVAAVPETEDPASDLVAAGLVFRRLAIEHTALFRVAFHDSEPAEAAWPEIRPLQRSALARLRARIARVLPEGAPASALRAHTFAFHALCEGLATLQLRGAPVGDAWEGSFRTLIEGMRRTDA